jgi:hypothetical protein
MRGVLLSRNAWQSARVLETADNLAKASRVRPGELRGGRTGFATLARLPGLAQRAAATFRNVSLKGSSSL